MADHEEEKITLFSARNSEVFVWNAQDVINLRLHYRIVGSLVGSLPRKPKQNVCLSLPLLLSEDETTLLLQKNLACLVVSPERTPPPSQEEVTIFHELRQKSFKEQIELFNEKNMEKEMQSFVEKTKKKKRKGRKRRLLDNEGIPVPEKLPKIDDSENRNLEKTVKNEDSSIRDTNLQTDSQEYSLLIENTMSDRVHTLDGDSGDISSSNYSEKTPTDNEHTVKNPQEAQDIVHREKACVIHIPTKMPACKTKNLPTQEWHYPKTEREKMKFKIFKDLWERGYYITSGSKFGGDFLAYPGDPFKFHSFFVVMIMHQSDKVGMLDLISIGRLAATVKKTALLGTVDRNGDVVYSSIKWSGIS